MASMGTQQGRLIVRDVIYDKKMEIVMEERTEFNIKINERLVSMETKMDALIDANKTALVILTGNGHPEEGLAFRVKVIETDEAGKRKNSNLLWTTLSSLGVLVVADFIHRAFFHKIGG